MKTLTPVLVVMLAVLLLVACTPTKSTEAQSSKTSQIAKDSSSQETGPSDTIFAECEDKSESAKMMSVYSVREDCLIEKTKSVEQCKSYKGKQVYSYGSIKRNFEQDQVDKCVQSLAVKNNDVHICDESGNLRADCYSAISVNTKNPKLCTGLSDVAICYKKYLVNLDINTECQKRGYLVNIISCFFEKLDLTTQQLSENGPAYCAFYETLETSYATDKDNICTASIGVYVKDTAMCDKAGKYRADCYRALALNSPQMTLKDCDKSGTDYVGCYIAIAVRNADTSICEKIPAGSKDDCKTQVAIKTKNLALCAEIGGSAGMQCAQQFVAGISKEDWDLQFCDAISKIGQGSGGPSPNQCFYEVGLRTLSMDTCNRITGEDATKDECKTRVGHALGR